MQPPRITTITESVQTTGTEIITATGAVTTAKTTATETVPPITVTLITTKTTAMRYSMTKTVASIPEALLLLTALTRRLLAKEEVAKVISILLKV